MVDTTSEWEDELGRWLKPLLDRLGHKGRLRMCPLYVSGLIGPGDRKSVQPMAARLSPGDCGQLHHLSLMASGMRHHWRRSCSFRPTDLSAAGMRCWSSTTPRCRRGAIIRLVSLRNVARLSARQPIARRWYR
jgi:hypothetical protein